MKIRFIEAPKGRHYKVGDVAEFNGPVPEGYARKYISRGWAVVVTEAPNRPAPKPAALQGGYSAAPSASPKLEAPTTGSVVKPDASDQKKA